MTIVDKDLGLVNENTRKVKSHSKGQNINGFDCFWLHFIITEITQKLPETSHIIVFCT